MSRQTSTIRRPAALLKAPASVIAGSGRLPRWKRAMDVVISVMALIVLAPVMALIALAVRVDSKGPALFRQERLGFNGRPFECWKFRSMCQDAEALRASLEAQNEADGHIFKMKDDPRRTRVGKVLRKTSLDELPQLWNVLRGEMSLVGPRPPLPSEVEKYLPEEWARLQGIPGMTGLWQVRARHRKDFQEMVRLDVEYLGDIRFRKDVAILLLTIPAVLIGRGAQ